MTRDPLRYLKGHGTGNDFVLLADPEDRLELTGALVRALCDRRTGLGADGVLRIAPASGGPARWFMDHRNADGSAPEMCGNGLRLFALFLLRSGLSMDHEQLIATRAGVRRAVVCPDGTVRVEMGAAELGKPSVALLGGVEYPGTAVSVGNPHLVCRVERPIDALDLGPVPVLDPAVFPDGANVEFVNADPAPVPGADAHVRLRVHERGVGETLACGTGACAVAAAVLAGTLGVVAVDQPGGRVVVTVGASGAELAGPAVFVASGELDPDWLAAVGRR